MAKRRKRTGGSRRKTFKKKSTAKNAARKGQSPYKVKGGWRLSKSKRRKRCRR